MCAFVGLERRKSGRCPAGAGRQLLCREVWTARESRDRLDLLTDEAYYAGDMSERRPTGIAIVATVYAVDAAWAFLAGVSYLLAPKMMTAVLKALYPPLYHDGMPAEAIGDRLLFLCICAISGALLYLVARGLWRLRNWARVIAIIFFVSDALGPRWPTDLFPVAGLLPVGPLSMILKGLLCLSVILYLVSPHVRKAFGMDPSGRISQIVFGALTVAILVLAIRKSGPELDAIRWHRQHGNRVNINGVMFPVYRWYVPIVRHGGKALDISDMPGPLREGDRMSFISVNDPYGEERNPEFTAEQHVDEKVQEYVRAGYRLQSKFQMNVGMQTMDCMQEMEYGRAIYCFGEGPIYSVFFTGNNEAYERFKVMMADAR
jgi:hypothetical protein